MAPVSIAQYAAIILGCAILIAVVLVYVRFTRFGLGGSTLTLVGLFLLGYSLYKSADISLSPSGGFHAQLQMIEWAAGSGAASAPTAPTSSTPPAAHLEASRVSPAVYRISIINSSKTLKDSEITSVLGPLQTQITEHFSPVWGIGAALSFAPGQTKAPPGAWTLLMLDDADTPSALSYHYVSGDGFPTGKVFIKTIREYGTSWTKSASHQLLEMLANPRINLTVLNSAAKGAGTLYAYEVADACQGDADGYKVNDVLVSDFVYPIWFDQNAKGDTIQFDYMRHIHKPLELCSGGWIAAYDIKGGEWRTIVK
jgi:hypothetical protein